MSASPRLSLLTRLALRLLVSAERRSVVEGDLLELRAARAVEGRRGLTRAEWRDLASIVWARIRPYRLRRSTTVQEAHGGASRAGNDLLQDIRYGLRLVRHQPGFAALVIGTLTLGIAASTAIFTVCDRVLLRPLPYRQPGQLVSLEQVHFGFSGRAMTVARDVAALPVFSAAGIYAPGGLNLGDDERPARVRAAAASAGFFDVLGVAPVVGHPYSPEEDRAAAPMAVLSYGAWVRHFGQDPAIAGRQIHLNSRLFTVTGVMPSGFGFPDDTDVWIPAGSDNQLTGEAFAPSLIARLAPNVTPAAAVDALERLNGDRRARNPDLSPSRPIVRPLQDQLTRGVRPTLLFLAAVVGLLLAATSANVAGLLLSRLRMRQRELHVRAALGAGRLRLARQLVTECFVLTAIGATAGLGVAMWAVRAFAASAPALAPNTNLTSIDVRSFLVGLAVTIFCGVLFSAAPAIAASRRPAAAALRESRTSTTGSSWFRSGLVASQVAAALVLLTATSAALSVVVRLAGVDVGFANDRALVFEMTLPLSRYDKTAAISDVIERIQQRLAAVPGVSHVGVTNLVPGSTKYGVGAPLWPSGQPDPPAEARRPAMLLSAGPSYFQVMGIRVLAGRAFTEADRTGAPPVVVLSESAARRLWNDVGGAVGKRVRSSLGRSTPADLEVVGVVSDVQLRGLVTELAPQMYMSIAQNPPFGGVGIAIDAATDPASLVAAVQAALRDVDSDLPIYDVRLVRDLRARFLASQRLTLELTLVFAVMTLVLCAIGVYGALSQAVAQRTREIGIRMALGADRTRLRWAFVLSGLRPAAGGIVGGLLVSGLAARLVARFVPALDAPSFRSVAAGAAIMLGVALLATWLPARRASAVNPILALRAE